MAGKKKKKVSFANHAMVLDFQKEDPTENIQWNVNAQTEAALSGSYIQDSPISNRNHNQIQPTILNSPQSRQHRTYSITSSDSNGDDAFLANTFSSPTQYTTTHHPPLRGSPHPNHSHTHSPMDIEHDDEDDDDAMDLTLTSTTPQIQTLHDLYNNNNNNNNNDDDDDDDAMELTVTSTTPQMEALNDLFNNDDDDITTNNMESLQDLFNEDDKTLTSIPEINDESTSFNKETKHLQTPVQDTKQSMNEFDAKLNDSNGAESMIIDNDSDDNNSNHNGSFTDNENENNNKMPALESPINDVDHSDQTYLNNLNQVFVDNDEDHTLRVQLPSHLLGTPLSAKQQKECRSKRRSSTNLTECILPGPNSLDLLCSNVNSSMLSDTMNLGSVTKCFRTKVNVNNVNDNINDNCSESNDADHEEESNTSFNTMLRNCSELIQEQYGLTQQNEEVNIKEIRSVAPDLNEIRDQQKEDEYSISLNEETPLNWREIASKYQWFPSIKKVTKYSLGLGIEGQRIDRVLIDRNDIILHQICDKIEYNELSAFHEKIKNDLVQIDDEIKVLEQKMDENDVITKQNIEKYGMNSNQCTQKLTECLKLKNQTNFDDLKLKYLTNINEKMNTNYHHLTDDLDKLMQIYNDLDKECTQKQEDINKLKEFETNKELMNHRKKIFENDKEIETAQNRYKNWNESLEIEKRKTVHLEENILSKKEKLAQLKEENVLSDKFELECDDLAECILFIHCISGIKMNQITQSTIELLLLRWVSFYMEYDNKTQRVYNIKFTKHKSPKYTDDFTKYLINMTHQIGNALNVKESIKTISDLKRIIWDIIELITGIAEIRRNINLIQNEINDCSYKVIIKPLRHDLNTKENEINIEIEMMKTMDTKCIRSSLLIQSIFNISIGHPYNRMHPQIYVVLIRKIYDENTKKYKALKDRMKQIVIEEQICKSIEHNLSKIKLGRDLLIRSVNSIKFEMDRILNDETNYRH